MAGAHQNTDIQYPGQIPGSYPYHAWVAEIVAEIAVDTVVDIEKAHASVEDHVPEKDVVVMAALVGW
ncbi:hypothetical protein KSZ_40210 [Dictyobacter formicarum]|uniref:Uncharacterized protein n=1 Tax=Dictyobacter formicarum TaxID=2778368 RepID=A0ABQ3VIJ0_9CHLR|nr:hypothetical protein KSZ_40210 [Dictyobacter formicarum]